MSGTFLKRNRTRFPDHLACEAAGLAVLRQAAAGTGIDVPEVLQVSGQSLRLEYIDAVPGSPEQWRRLGHGLATIHARPATRMPLPDHPAAVHPGVAARLARSTVEPVGTARFGFDTDNYIGGNRQPNGWSSCWGEFFVRQRLGFQVGLVSDARVRRDFRQRLERHGARLREFLDGECTVSSLLHGDLWSGNVLCGADGRVWLIDPAVYFGDGDADLAMTEMFGGFPPAFHTAYRERRPGSRHYGVKRRLYNLYHYLNHYNLFGGGYLDGCEDGFAVMESL